MAQSWPINSPERSRRYRTPWQIHKAVVFALFLREMKTRFGSKRFGYFWAVLQPASMILAWWGMYALALRGGRSTGVDFPIFLLTGIVPYSLFRSILSSGMNAYRANRGLFNYRQVKPLDTLVARCLVECMISLVVFVILGFLGRALGYDAAVQDLLGLCLSLLLLVWFSFGVGLVFSVFAVFFETFPNVVGFVLTPMFFISGVIIPIQSIPERFHEILFYNPVLHLMELIRIHYFAHYESPNTSIYYIVCWILFPNCIGLWLYDRFEQRIVMSS